jgi:hypothetical protein
LSISFSVPSNLSIHLTLIFFLSILPPIPTSLLSPSFPSVLFPCYLFLL